MLFAKNSLAKLRQHNSLTSLLFLTFLIMAHMSANAAELKVTTKNTFAVTPLKPGFYKPPAPCKQPVVTHHFNLLNDKSLLKPRLARSGNLLCAPINETETAGVHRFHTAATGTQVFGGDGDYPTSDMSYIFPNQYQQITIGETAVFDVIIDWGNNNTSLIAAADSQTHQANLVITELSAPIISASTTDRFQISVATDFYTEAGEYQIKVMGLAGPSSRYLEPQYVYLSVVAPPENTDIADMVELGAFARFSPTQLDTTGATVSELLTGEGNATRIVGYLDRNNNGILDDVTTSRNNVYPAHTDGFGELLYGSAYATGANLIVLGQLSQSMFVAVHFNVSGGTVTPLLAMAGDTEAGLVMLQDVDFNDAEVHGLIDSAGNSYMTGHINFDPFYYDGINNVIYANHVEFSFTTAIENQ
ncbi:MAG: hypothetical protein MI976_17645 [Pseudomonadales bacterium]|nr:hypothetical protein [Pseudomonadales bacterium]